MGVQEYEHNPDRAGLSGETNTRQLRQCVGGVGACGCAIELHRLSHSCHPSTTPTFNGRKLFLTLRRVFFLLFKEFAIYAAPPGPIAPQS